MRYSSRWLNVRTRRMNYWWGSEVSTNDTALDLGDAPEPEELLLLSRRFGDSDIAPGLCFDLSADIDLLLTSLGELDLDLD